MPARRGSWAALAPKTRARWRAAYGGRGTPGQRDARAERAYEGGARISRTHAGHEPAATRATRSMSGFVGAEARLVDFHGLDRAEARRLGRHNALVAQLASGQIGTAEFERRTRAFRPLRGERLASNAAAVLARLDQLRAEDHEPFAYSPGRAA